MNKELTLEELNELRACAQRITALVSNPHWTADRKERILLHSQRITQILED